MEASLHTLYRMVARFPCLGGILIATPGGRLQCRTADGRPTTTITPTTDVAHLACSPDLEATLLAGRLIYRRGLFESGGDAPLVLQRAHALPRVLAHRVAAWLDAEAAHRRRPLLVVYDPEDAAVSAEIALRLAFSVAWEDVALPLHLPAVEEKGSLPPADIPVQMMESVVRAAHARGVDSHGEYLTMRAAQAYAAFQGRSLVTDTDLAWAFRMVLDPRTAAPGRSTEGHRTDADSVHEITPDAPSTPPPPAAESQDDSGAEAEIPRGSEPPQQPSSIPSPSPSSGEASGVGREPAVYGVSSAPEGGGQGDDSSLVATEVVASRALPPAPPPPSPTKVRERAGTAPSPARMRMGRHGASRAKAATGRSWQRTSASMARRIDLVATIQAAAPWQRLRPRRPGTAVTILPGDLRYQRPHVPNGELLVVVLDASASMWPRAIARAKGYALQLLDEAYRRRADVALIAVRGVRPQLLVSPGRRYTAAERAVRTLPVGGGTPLAAGLELARRVAAPYGADTHVHLWLLTDGRGALPPQTGGHGPIDPHLAFGAFRMEWAQWNASCHVVDFAPPGSGAAAERLAAALEARLITPRTGSQRSPDRTGRRLLQP